MKFKISEQQPTMAQGRPIQQPVQQALPTYDPNTGLNIPAANLQDPNFVRKLNMFFKQNGINLLIPVPKPQQQVQQQQQMR